MDLEQLYLLVREKHKKAPHWDAVSEEFKAFLADLIKEAKKRK